IGNPNGLPVVFLHGGPGSSLKPSYRQLFDPNVYRVVLFNQRGAGKSKPGGSLINNTTWHLVDDIEHIREILNIDKWGVVGGSWGSTLALAYAEKYPDKVHFLVVCSIFTCSSTELNWTYDGNIGAAQLFPEAFERFRKKIPDNEQTNLLQAYHRRLTSDDLTRAEKIKFAIEWCRWETIISTFTYCPESVDADIEKAQQFGVSLKNPQEKSSIPGTIVHGRYDCCCPVSTAYHLYQSWPDSKLIIVADAGHSQSNSALRQAIVEAIDQYKPPG
ncbi:unnamed protein product, partial [Didymodactylos carnosus]